MVKQSSNSVKTVINGIYLKIKKQNTSSIIGYILLIPPLLGVLSFVIDIPFSEKNDVIVFSAYYVNVFWFGMENLPSQFPLYFGLMALAGAYLIKDNK